MPLVAAHFHNCLLFIMTVRSEASDDVAFQVAGCQKFTHGSRQSFNLVFRPYRAIEPLFLLLRILISVPRRLAGLDAAAAIVRRWFWQWIRGSGIDGRRRWAEILSQLPTTYHLLAEYLGLPTCCTWRRSAATRVVSRRHTWTWTRYVKDWQTFLFTLLRHGLWAATMSWQVSRSSCHAQILHRYNTCRRLSN